MRFPRFISFEQYQRILPPEAGKLRRINFTNFLSRKKLAFLFSLRLYCFFKAGEAAIVKQPAQYREFFGINENADKL